MPNASNAPRCATGISSLTTVSPITLMTDGTAMPIVASAILAAMPGTYGMTAKAGPPSATQPPPSRPRGLDTPCASRRCEYQPAAKTDDDGGAGRQRAQQADRALREPEPLDQKRPLPRQRLREAPVGAEIGGPADQKIVGLSNSCP